MGDSDAIARLIDLVRLDEPVRVVDIGANPIDGSPPYEPLLRAGACQVIGFEPHPEALRQLEARKSANETYLPHAVGDGTPRTLHLCRHSGWTSMLEPDPRSLDLFGSYRDNAEVVGEQVMATVRLDDLTEIPAIDYLKIDIQGAELDAIAHGSAKLSRALVVHTEVSLFPVYRDQPGFGEIDIALRRLGLLPHHLGALKKCIMSPMLIGNDPWASLNQLLDADLIYVRDIRNRDEFSAGDYRKTALIAHACYGSYDLALLCIQRLIEQAALPGDAFDAYLGMVNEVRAP